MTKAKGKIKIEGEPAPDITFEQFKAWQQSQASATKAASSTPSAKPTRQRTSAVTKAKNEYAKRKNSVGDVLGFALHANGRVDAIKQGSGIYGSGFGTNAFSETAFSSTLALSQSTFGWSAAYSVSTWCYRCVEVRANAVSRMPWHIYSKRTGKIVQGEPIEIALRRNRQNLLQRHERSKLLYGETFIELAKIDDKRNPFVGSVSDLYWLNNNGMAVIQGAGYIMGYNYTAMQGGEPQTFDVGDVAFYRTWNPMNDLRGMSPTEVMMDEIAIDKDVARVVRAFYANDTRVGLLLIPKTNLQPGDAEMFMQTWKMQHQGINNAGKPILMPQDMSVERVQEPATLDDVQLRESVRREIAAGYGVPLALAGAWDEANYDSVDTQRKSFYEETIIPECDEIAAFVNREILPHFDDSGRVLFKFDYTTVLALGEDANAKQTSISAKLTAGAIMLDEAREALGDAPLPNGMGQVFYLPAGIQVVRPRDLATMAQQTATPPQPPPMFGGQSMLPSGDQPTPDDTPPDNQPPPRQPPALPAPNKPPPPQPKSVVAQSSAEDELAAWEKRALNTNAVKATLFICHHLTDDVQTVIRADLNAAGIGATKATLRGVFARAKEMVKPPDQALRAWQHYDKLMKQIGNDWLNTYMAQALVNLSSIATDNLTDADVQAALDAAHPDFETALLGTDDNPGALVKLITAGMAAATESIYDGSAGNPHRPVMGKAIDIDWKLMAVEARDAALEYIGNLIRNVDDTTRKYVREAVAHWIETGEPLSELKKALNAIFNDPVRASAIAETETTNAFTRGAIIRYERADVKKIKCSTIRDTKVCDICKPIEGTTVLLSEGFNTKSGNRYPPFHVRCRHWPIPVVEDL